MKPNQLKSIAFIFVSLFLNNYSALSQNCIYSTSYSISEIYNNDDGTCDYEIDLCAEVNGSPRPKRIVYAVDYDTDGDGTKESSLSFEFDPAGNHISNGTYCLSTMPSDESFVVTVSCGSEVQVSIIGYKSNSGNGGSCKALSEDISATSLPVELVDFRAKTINEQVLLEWTTASEVDNDYFAIEQSNDGAKYQTIGQVDGQGNSATLQQYSFIDTTPVVGDNFYRLRQVDLNGATAFSDVSAVKVKERGDYLIYPSFAREQVTIEFGKRLELEVSIQLIDVRGKLVKELFAEQGDKMVRIEVSDLIDGMYVVSFDRGQGRLKTGRFFRVS